MFPVVVVVVVAVGAVVVAVVVFAVVVAVVVAAVAVAVAVVAVVAVAVIVVVVAVDVIVDVNDSASAFHGRCRRFTPVPVRCCATAVNINSQTQEESAATMKTIGIAFGCKDDTIAVS